MSRARDRINHEATAPVGRVQFVVLEKFRTAYLSQIITVGNNIHLDNDVGYVETSNNFTPYISW